MTDPPDLHPALQRSVVQVWRAPVHGARRRLSRAAAFRDWARAIIKRRYRTCECSPPEPDVGLGSSWCDLHDPDVYPRAVRKLAALLEARHG